MRQGSRQGVIAKTALLVSVMLFALSACNRGNNTEKPSTKGAKPPVPITTVVATTQLMPITHQTFGTLYPRKAPIIRARIAGVVDVLAVHQGEPVKKGQLLLTMHQEAMQIDLTRAEEKLKQSEAMLEAREKGIKRMDKLIGTGYVSKEKFDLMQAQYETAKTNVIVAKSDLAHAKFKAKQKKIVSPIDGFVNKIAISEGEYVHQGTSLMNLINHQILRAELPFSEKQTRNFHIGQRVLLVSANNKSEKIDSTITAIQPDIDPKNRAFNAIVIFKNEYRWKPGSSIEAIIYEKPLKTITVPNECIIEQNGQHHVFVIKKGKALQKTVNINYQVEGWAGIKTGLNDGDVIALDGVHYLSNGATVHVTAKSKLK